MQKRLRILLGSTVIYRKKLRILSSSQLFFRDFSFFFRYNAVVRSKQVYESTALHVDIPKCMTAKILRLAITFSVAMGASPSIAGSNPAVRRKAYRRWIGSSKGNPRELNARNCRLSRLLFSKGSEKTALPGLRSRHSVTKAKPCVPPFKRMTQQTCRCFLTDRLTEKNTYGGCKNEKNDHQ